jgi:hypothetical protein
MGNKLQKYADGDSTTVSAARGSRVMERGLVEKLSIWIATEASCALLENSNYPIPVSFPCN